MKIPQEYPQFEEKNTLLVVMGTNHGIIYQAKDGTLEKIDELLVEEPEYSDNEGMFKRGGGDQTTYGSVLESKKEEYQKRFSKDLAEKVLDLSKKGNLEQIYLFYPKMMSHLVEEDWNENLKKIILVKFDGNYTKESPTELLEKIKNKRENDDKKDPEGEAKEILEKF
ncbi:MAG: host attachment protein [bacterium]